MGIFKTCPVDIDKWQALNRVKLYSNQINRWVIARTTSDTPNIVNVRDGVLRVMREKWFNDETIDGLNIVAVSFDRPPVQPGEQRREDLPQPPMLKRVDKGLIYVTIDFNYRGLEKSIAWPVWDQADLWEGDLSWLKKHHECPLTADLMLEGSLVPLGVAPKLEEKNVLGLTKSNVNLMKVGLYVAGGVLAFRLYSVVRSKIDLLNMIGKRS